MVQQVHLQNSLLGAHGLDGEVLFADDLELPLLVHLRLGGQGEAFAGLKELLHIFPGERTPIVYLKDSRRELPFHRMLLAGELPLTMGGGIGQSRLCMILLGKAHIGEVQASIWDEETIRACQDAGVILL